MISMPSGVQSKCSTSIATSSLLRTPAKNPICNNALSRVAFNVPVLPSRATNPLQVLDRPSLCFLLRAAVRARDSSQGLAHGRRRRRIEEALLDVPLRQRHLTQRQGAWIDGPREGEQVADDCRLVGRQHATPRKVVVHGGPVGPARVVCDGCRQDCAVLGCKRGVNGCKTGMQRRRLMRIENFGAVVGAFEDTHGCVSRGWACNGGTAGSHPAARRWSRC